jgi:hypothetical protein
MKYKIQIPSMFGWADQKVSIDDSPYEVELFDTEEEAQEEADILEAELDDYEYRIVTEDVLADEDIYE